MKEAIFSCLFCLFSLTFGNQKIVHIPDLEDVQCDGVRAFVCRNVPYAVHPFRFQEAMPITSSQNRTNTYNFLTIDVFTKKLLQQKSVIVGLLQDNLGEFEFTSIPRLMLKKVVFVNVRYRSGLFGFLSTNTPEIPGNRALSDVVLALQWVQKYISYFGGNPENVTLMGLEDSGALVHALAISPATPKNLFNKIIIGETTAFTPRLVTSSPYSFSFQVATEFGCPALNSVADVNSCLLNPGNNLGRVIRSCSFQNNKRTNFSPVKLAIGNHGKYLPEHPKVLIERTEVPFPALMGTSLCVQQKTFDDFISEDDFKNFVPYAERTIDDALVNIDRFGDPAMKDKWIDTIQFQISEMTAIYSRRQIYKLVLENIIKGMDSRDPILEAANSSSTTHLYYFNHNFATLNSNQLGFMEFDSFEPESEEEKAFRTLINIWTTFAETGEPPKYGHQKYDNWKKVGESKYPFFKLGLNSYVDENFENLFQKRISEAMGLI